MAEAVVEGRPANSSRFFCHLCNVEINSVNSVNYTYFAKFILKNKKNIILGLHLPIVLKRVY